MNRSGIFLGLSIAGLLIPWAVLGFWIAAMGFNPLVFVQEMFRHPVSAFLSAEVILAAVAMIVFIRVDQKRRAIPASGYAILGTALAGPSFGLPFYLYLRERSR